MMCGFVKVNVYSDNPVPRVVELMVSLKEVATKSLVFLILAVTLPDGVPVFFKQTFQDFKDFPINKDEDAASSPVSKGCSGTQCTNSGTGNGHIIEYLCNCST